MDKFFVHYHSHLLLTPVRLDFGLFQGLRKTSTRFPDRNCLVAGRTVVREGVNSCEGAADVCRQTGEDKRKRSPPPASSCQPDCLSPPPGSLAIALNTTRRRVTSCGTRRAPQVVLHVFLSRMLLNPGPNSAVAERTIYPGFFLPKVLELKWIVLVVDCHCHVVLIVARRRFGRFASK